MNVSGYCTTGDQKRRCFFRNEELSKQLQDEDDGFIDEMEHTHTHSVDDGVTEPEQEVPRSLGPLPQQELDPLPKNKVRRLFNRAINAQSRPGKILRKSIEACAKTCFAAAKSFQKVSSPLGKKAALKISTPFSAAGRAFEKMLNPPLMAKIFVLRADWSDLYEEDLHKLRELALTRRTIRRLVVKVSPESAHPFDMDGPLAEAINGFGSNIKSVCLMNFCLETHAHMLAKLWSGVESAYDEQTYLLVKNSS